MHKADPSLNTGFRGATSNAPRTQTQTAEEIMNIIKSLKGFFINLFSGKTTDPASHPPGSKAEGKKAGTGGVETRCINPDNGCSFEMS
jgi:hypothetical protein